MIERVTTVVFVLAALPLLIYPGLLLAGLMGLAAPPTQDASPLITAVAKSFLWLSVCYPVGYFIALTVSTVWSKRFGTILAGTYLAACIVLFIVWYVISKE